MYTYHTLLLAKGVEHLSVSLVLGDWFMQTSIPVDENHLLPFGTGEVKMCWSREQACLVVLGMDILPVRVPIYAAEKHITIRLQTDFNLHNLKNDHIINKSRDV